MAPILFGSFSQKVRTFGDQGKGESHAFRISCIIYIILSYVILYLFCHTLYYILRIENVNKIIQHCLFGLLFYIYLNLAASK